MNKEYIIRNERKEDYREVENLTREAFWNVYRPGCQEHFVLNRQAARCRTSWRRNSSRAIGETVIDPSQGRDTPIRVLRLEL